MIEQQAIDSHERFSPGDEVTIGKGVVVYEIIAAYRDGTVMLREADAEKPRKREVNTAKSTLVDVYLTAATHTKRDAATAERRRALSQKWMENTIASLRGDLTQAQQRFERYSSGKFMLHEHAVSALADWTALNEVVEQLDQLLELPELEGESLWTKVEIIASKQMHYGARSSSDRIHDALYRITKDHWMRLLTTAVAVRLSAENHPARHHV